MKNCPKIIDKFNFSNIFDICYLDNFSEEKELRSPPDSFRKAVSFLSSCLDNKKAINFHKKIHLPLATRVLPAIERAGAVFYENPIVPRTVYANYDLEEHINGRLTCRIYDKNMINPHSLDDEQRQKIGPVTPYSHFIYFDYRAMEVCVLQWLSKDENLYKIISDSKNGDFYEEIYKKMSNCENEIVHPMRSFIKETFLPVFYGRGAASISEQYQIPLENTRGYTNLIAESFPRAWEWIEKKQEEAKISGQITDYFGRTRTVDQPYLARNFVVSAPAATICMHKLIRLFDNIPKDSARITFSIHDAYVVAAKKENFWKTVKICKTILEEEDFPGLILKTTCEFGKRLKKIHNN
jgi:DNA polymerase I-like protein with 3'-5' exonuclease and polymerase domains